MIFSLLQLMTAPIYLDYQSTTPTDKRVLDQMYPYFTEFFANPSSSHKQGVLIQEAVENARKIIVSALNGENGNLFFTGCATEGINFVFSSIGRLSNEKSEKPHIITQNTEHKAVLECCAELENKGIEVTILPVDKDGLVSASQVKQSIKKNTVLVAIMHANNEIGVVQPIEAIGKICRENNLLFFVDAAQSAGKIPIDVKKTGIDYLVISGHKIYGPKGIAALYASPKGTLRLYPLLLGGGQEENLRSGTLNVPGIIGLSTALSLSLEENESENERIKKLSNFFFTRIQDACGDIYINGHPRRRLAGNLNLLIKGVPNILLVKQINRHISLSTASACLSASAKASYVLGAIGLTDEEVSQSVRISFGRFTTPEEAENAALILIKNIHLIRTTRA